jgi:hypothetical protein
MKNYNQGTFSIQYNEFYAELIPENIIYFKPYRNKLKIIISYGDFGKWLNKLSKKEIESKIFKRSTQKLSFTIDKLQYLENKNLIEDIIKDTLNRFQNNDFSEYSAQTSLF